MSKKGVTNDFLAEKDPFFFFFFFSVWFLREVKEIKEEGGGRREEVFNKETIRFNKGMKKWG